MSNQAEQRDVRAIIDRAADVEREGIVVGAQNALTEEAARTRGVRTGASLGAGATEQRIALSMGFQNANELRAQRKADPGSVLAALMSGAR